ncbi:MAG: hypothetical protein IJ015_05620 [Ruminococcus sp.]|nr:hypothetical protein [Ruminococcus sp.]
MIKGISHQIIEVTDTNNRYYERALLVLKPEYASISREILEKEAKKLLAKMDTVSTIKPKNVFFSRLLSYSLMCAIGALTTVIIYTLV